MGERLTSIAVEPAVRVRWEPEQVLPGLYRLPLPYPFGSSVNALVVPGADGALMIDAGHHSHQAGSALDAQLERLGLRRADVRRVLVTHADHDHDGFARELAGTGAAVLCHPLERDRGPLWSGSSAWLAANGFPEPLPARPAEPSGLPADVELVEDGAVVSWAGFEFRLIHCPGHTPGLVCAFDERRRLLASSDHVLRVPSPIGLFFDHGDPVGDYLASLARVRDLEAETVVPGHGRAFGGLRERVDAITADVHRELGRVEAELWPEPATAWEMVRRLEPSAAGWHRVMAMFFTLARLRHLERTGRAVLVEAAPGLLSYRAA